MRMFLLACSVLVMQGCQTPPLKCPETIVVQPAVTIIQPPVPAQDADKPKAKKSKTRKTAKSSTIEAEKIDPKQLLLPEKGSLTP